MKNTLKKILAELNSENPRLDYIKGMLEVLIGEDEVGTFYKVDDNFKAIKEVIDSNMDKTFIDEALILDNKAKAHIERFGMPTQND